MVDHTPDEEEEPEPSEDEAENEAEDEGLSSQRLSSMIRTLENVKSQVAAWDPDMMRAPRFRNAIDLAIEPYRHERIQLKKQHNQLPITMFLDTIETPAISSSPDEIAPVETVYAEDSADEFSSTLED